MNILLTGSLTPLGRAIGAALGGTHSVTPFTGDLRDLETGAGALMGIDAIVHLAPLDRAGRDDDDWLDHSTRGSYLLAAKAAEAGARLMITASTLALFPAALAERYRVDPSWRPQPDTSTAQLCAWLSELCVRETVRINRLKTVCVRLRAIEADIDAQTQLIQNLLSQEKHADWSIVHAGDPLGAATSRDARPAIAPRPIRTVAVFGAAGPLGTVVTRELSDRYQLRLSDVKPIDALIATAARQSPGAPLPERPDPKHSWVPADVRDAAQVDAVVAGADAVINLSVIRNNIAGSFQVNMIGAHNVMRAAIRHGIHRVVHTGPFQMGDHGNTGYDWDYDIVDDVPARPGIAWLYFMGKLCGQEIVKIIAREHGMSVPMLTFCEFVDESMPGSKSTHPLVISWRDSARAVRAALEVPTLPSPYEYFHIGADVPHDVYRLEKAHRLLGWRAQDRLDSYFTR
jgi:nucleoside-diphosphate-sugar epimerase